MEYGGVVQRVVSIAKTLGILTLLLSMQAPGTVVQKCNGRNKQAEGQLANTAVFHAPMSTWLCDRMEYDPNTSKTHSFSATSQTPLAFQCPLSCVTWSNSPLFGAYKFAPSAAHDGRESTTASLTCASRLCLCVRWQQHCHRLLLL